MQTKHGCGQVKDGDDLAWVIRCVYNKTTQTPLTFWTIFMFQSGRYMFIKFSHKLHDLKSLMSTNYVVNDKLCVCVCVCSWPAVLKGSVRFSMFHWPQQYCEPLHIHSSRTPNRTTDTDCQRPPIPDPPPTPSNAVTPDPHRPLKKTSHLVQCERVTWLFGPAAHLHLFCADCFKGFCLHQQKRGGDNFLEFSLGLPLWHFAHSWLALSLTHSLSLSISLFPWGKADT